MSEESENPDVVDAATEAVHATEADVLEGEQPAGVSTENMTKDEAKAAMGEFLAHVGIIGADGKPVEVTFEDPIVITGQREVVERAGYAELAEEQRMQARAEGAHHADLEVSEALDEPITLATTLESLERLLAEAQRAVKLLRKTDAWARENPVVLPDTSDEL